MTDNQMTKSNQRQRTTLLTGSLYLLMFAYAISMTIIGPLIPVYIKKYGISLAAGGLITALQGLGGVLSVLAGAIVADRLKKSAIIFVTFLIYTLSVILLAFLGSYAILVISFFLIGASTKILDVALNAKVSDINPIRRKSAISLLHAIFSIGALAGTVLSAWLVDLRLTPENIFLLFSLLCMFSFIVYLFASRRETPETIIEKPRDSEKFGSFLRNRKILMLCLTSITYTGLFISISTWMPLYMQETFRYSSLRSSIPVTIFLVGLVAGRTICTAFSEKYDFLKIMFYSHLTCCGLWFLATLIKSPELIIAASLAAGLGVSGVVPISISTACGWYPEHSGKLSAMIILFVTIGIMIPPWLYGVLAQLTSYQFSVVIFGLMPLAATICLGILLREIKKSN